ncbi:MAG: ABC transporter permease [Chloroflexi bacterium]|nr:ABC transporter permease [Chloroflexota bacterium]MCL5274781.1 ABC transporter permease [Chloroflexota bacterium]
MTTTVNRIDKAANAAQPAGRLHPAAQTWLLRITPFLMLCAFLLAWHLVSLRYPPFILPGPLSVADRLIEKLLDGTLIRHTAITLSEAIPGLIVGALFGFATGYPIAKSHVVDRLLSPFIVASQGVPFIAVAPLLLIWFGNGIGAKVFLCAIVVFFPITINVIVGLRSISPLLHELFRSMNATRWETFHKLELPAALPMILAGLRVGGTLSMIGALAAEFLGTDQGLGFVINQGRGLYDTPLVLAGIVTTVFTALCIYGSIRLLERALIK